MNKTALIADRAYLKHYAGRVHPERPERIEAMIEMVEDSPRSDLKIYRPRAAAFDELALCHQAEYIEAVERTAGLDRFDFDPDTHTSPETWKTATLAAGGVLTAAETVLDGAARNSFAIVRPPGHHALRERAMGFCFFNNVAIAAAWLTRVRGLKRVLILDWDVHHGNGTQEIFYESPQILYMSIHQFPLYPGTGWLDETGSGAGAGFTVNAPLPATCGNDEYLSIFDELFLPIARLFNPEFILVSAGFDCHQRDPLAMMRVNEDGFTAMARRLKRLAAECCDGKLVAVLEGGYDLRALVDSGRALIDELGREADETIIPVAMAPRAVPIVERAKYFLGPHWKLD